MSGFPLEVSPLCSNRLQTIDLVSSLNIALEKSSATTKMNPSKRRSSDHGDQPAAKSARTQAMESRLDQVKSSIYYH